MLLATPLTKVRNRRNTALVPASATVTAVPTPSSLPPMARPAVFAADGAAGKTDAFGDGADHIDQSALGLTDFAAVLALAT